MAASRQRKRKRKEPKARATPTPRKQPRLPFHPEASKVPVAEGRRDFMGYHPRWRFALLDLEGPYGWRRLERGAAPDLHGKLAQLERRTWNEIFVRDKHRNHSVELDRLSPDAAKRLKRKKLDDFGQLWSLRITGACRVWGILVEDVFYLLWWDPDHDVCPSLLKHT